MKKIIYLIILIVSITNFGNTAEVTTQEFLKGCKNYYLWVNKNYEIPVDEKILFNMGKCQGVIETMGKVMLTLCYESKRNLSISKQITANLKGIRTIEIIEELIKSTDTEKRLRSMTVQTFLFNFMSNNWPCK
tara:strand:+ start:107 stop:505 length:399 start_codon:yes stop_codon:yes gene_type:complete